MTLDELKPTLRVRDRWWPLNVYEVTRKTKSHVYLKCLHECDVEHVFPRYDRAHCQFLVPVISITPSTRTGPRTQKRPPPVRRPGAA